MNRISPKIGQEIGMFFKNDHLNTRSGKQEAEHHARGTPSRDAATRAHSFVHANFIMAFRYVFLIRTQEGIIAS